MLTDVVPTKMGGPEIAIRAKELRPGIRVIFMSGFSDETLLRHGLSARSQDLLEKPFTPSAVLERVRRQLDISDMRGSAVDPVPAGDSVA